MRKITNLKSVPKKFSKVPNVWSVIGKDKQMLILKNTIKPKLKLQIKSKDTKIINNKKKSSSSSSDIVNPIIPLKPGIPYPIPYGPVAPVPGIVPFAPPGTAPSSLPPTVPPHTAPSSLPPSAMAPGTAPSSLPPSAVAPGTAPPSLPPSVSGPPVVPSAPLVPSAPAPPAGPATAPFYHNNQEHLGERMMGGFNQSGQPIKNPFQPPNNPVEDNPPYQVNTADKKPLNKPHSKKSEAFQKPGWDKVQTATIKSIPASAKPTRSIEIKDYEKPKPEKIKLPTSSGVNTLNTNVYFPSQQLMQNNLNFPYEVQGAPAKPPIYQYNNWITMEFSQIMII